MKDKFVVKWSKKEKDWQGHYPDVNGKIITGALFGMISDFDKHLFRYKISDNLREYLERGGYDPDTFTITCKLKQPHP